LKAFHPDFTYITSDTMPRWPVHAAASIRRSHGVAPPLNPYSGGPSTGTPGQLQPMTKKLLHNAIVHMALAIAVGMLLGYFFPSIAAQMKPFSDGFLRLISMLIGVLIFCLVDLGHRRPAKPAAGHPGRRQSHRLL
jgi:hypothetical protein